MTSLLKSLTKNKKLLIYAILGAMVIVSVYKGNLFDALWTIMTFSVAYILMAWVLAPMLLPIDRFLGYALRGLFLRFLSGEQLSFIVVREGKVVAPAKKEKRKSTKDKPEEEGPWVGRGAILTDGTSVVVMKTETGISRVVGPGSAAESKSESGVIFTYYSEQVDSIIDLRPQIRSQEIEAMTRDGIPVKVRVTAFFTLKGTQAKRSIDMAQSTPHPFTWRQASVRQSFHNKRFARIDGKEEHTPWSDRVLEIAIPQLRQLIAQSTLDYLTAPLLADRHPRFEIKKQLISIVQRELDSQDDFKRGSGIQIKNLTVSIIWPPPQVVAQRIEAWKKEWHKKETEVMGRAEAQALITKEQARANAQGELTARINDTLQNAKASGTSSSDLVALRFLEVMEKMAKDPTTRALLTLDSLNMLNKLREMLKISGSDDTP
jgi:regulator of protease activity HflC (stomatin/prohibitin superfamily)